MTIDNHKYQRYEGDLQILKKGFLADEKINVVGDAGKAAVIIEKIKEGEKFKFKIKGDA
ncbi:MAG: phospho-sugar glycosidase domain-containing protein [Halanaerobiales bacterium]|nr:phospho-sugar glycosidase domain-containing protein [Halanaerobiales bacterium]